MNRIEELETLQAEHRKLSAKIESMQEEVRVLSDTAAEVKKIASERGLNLRELALALAPELASLTRKAGSTQAAPRTRSPRKTKVYLNPHTNEEIRTKGGNHKTLKEWKQKWGSEEVEGWASAE